MVKSVLNKLKVQDDWFLVDYTVNPFIGCSFNCVYCYIHGSKYGGEDTTTLQVKINAPQVLRRQLKNRARRREYGIIGVGSSTEPYLPLEEKLGLTREILKIIYRFKFPVNINTKSTLVLRDLELLRKIDASAILPPNLQGKLMHGAIISFSISTLEGRVARVFEPQSPKPYQRLETMSQFKEEGFLVGVNLMPVLPYLSDSEESLDSTIRIIKDYGADFVLVGGLTLFGDKPTDCKVRYYEALKHYFPEVLAKTRKLFSNSYPSKVYQRNLAHRASRLCEKHGIRNSILDPKADSSRQVQFKIADFKK